MDEVEVLESGSLDSSEELEVSETVGEASEELQTLIAINDNIVIARDVGIMSMCFIGVFIGVFLAYMFSKYLKH